MLFAINDRVQWTELGLENHGDNALGPLIVEDVKIDTEDEYVYILTGFDENENLLIFAATEDELAYSEDTE